MSEHPQTWHYGLTAQYWAEFHEGGPEIEYYQRLIEQFGQPALDVACGTGRLLLPFLRAGLDVDGTDISADMIAHCKAKTAQEGFSPTLTVQASHDLALTRTYQTIVVCGSFGLGATREQDFVALQRFYDHLVPGGVLLLENHAPYGGDSNWLWEYWLKDNWHKFANDWWPEPDERVQASDGSEFVQLAKCIGLNPLEQQMTLTMRTQQWQDDQLVAEETGTLTGNLYFKYELLMMLDKAGFCDVEIQGDFSEAEATADHGVLVFIARKAFVEGQP